MVLSRSLLNAFTRRLVILVKMPRLRIAVFLSLLVAYGQTDPRPRFESAVIKPSGAESRIGARNDPGRVAMTKQTLWRLIYFAYGLTPTEMTGGPPWIDKDEFDVSASLNTTEVASTAPEQRRQNWEALQALLEERFHLRFHHHSRIQSILVLTVAKSGFKLKDGEKLTAGTGPGFNRATMSRFVRTNVPISELARGFSAILNCHVDDRTGLSNSYSFDFAWPRQPAGADGIGLNINDDEIDAVATVLHERLGLDLTRGKGPVDIFVIDGAEKPLENWF